LRTALELKSLTAHSSRSLLRPVHAHLTHGPSIGDSGGKASFGNRFHTFFDKANPPPDQSCLSLSRYQSAVAFPGSRASQASTMPSARWTPKIGPEVKL
jgi:hypothetical protein